MMKEVVQFVKQKSKAIIGIEGGEVCITMK